MAQQIAGTQRAWPLTGGIRSSRASHQTCPQRPRQLAPQSRGPQTHGSKSQKRCPRRRGKSAEIEGSAITYPYSATALVNPALSHCRGPLQRTQAPAIAMCQSKYGRDMAALVAAGALKRTPTVQVQQVSMSV